MTERLTPVPARRSDSAPRRLLRRLAGALGIGSALLAAAGIATHFMTTERTVVVLVASFAPYFLVPAMVSVVLLACARWWLAAIAAVAVALVGVVSQLPLYVGTHPDTASEAPTVTLLQANVLYGQADPRALVTRVRDSGVDVLVVSELTEAGARRFADAGLEQALPYSYLRPRGGAGGGGIYSRFPLTDAAELPGFDHTNLRAEVSVPGADPVAVFALHPWPPYPGPTSTWAQELDRIGFLLAAERRALIVGADFNSTYDHARFRALLRAGARDGSEVVDAGEYLGSGFVATFPADRGFPAVLAIDRILTRAATPLSFDRVDLPGSDHHGVISEIRLQPAGRS